MSAPWWKSAVVYQVYPRSFADSDGNGIGDLEGLRRRLDHLAWLGVDAVWLSPFYRSPMADFGYDVSDYCDVDPVFGTLDDFDRLVADAHGLGVKVIVDWVPNHTSDQHPWFEASRSSRSDPKRDWYVWRDPGPDGAPNNWMAAFGPGPAWTLDEATGQYYLHLFLPEQPDLNWDHPDVEAAMHEVLRFWLDRGVDGFRMDVIHAIGKHPDLPDDEGDAALLPHATTNHVPGITHPRVRRLRKVLEEYPGDRMLVGEVFLLDTALVATYYDGGLGMHLPFNFPPLFTRWRADKWRRQVDEVRTLVEPQGWPTWVLSNHDNKRHRTRYGTEARARAAAVLLLTLRGTPFLFAGEELGLEDAVIPADRVVDPGGRDGCRAPVPWTGDPDHGWGTTDPWLPWPPDADARNAEALRADERSILHLYRRILAARRASDALRWGSMDLIDDVPDGVLAWRRSLGDDERMVAINFTDGPIELGGSTFTDLVVEVSSDGTGEGKPFPGTLTADQAVILT
jgi:alpha-glucosidase